jgi:arylformamidase
MISPRKFIDLTYDIEEGMPTFDAPWHPKVFIKQLGRIDREGRESRKICLGTHTGTHIDSPLHFIKRGISIDRISLSKLFGAVDIVDLSRLKENESITLDIIKTIKVGRKMIFKFGWSKFWGNKKFYKGYPFFTKEAAKYLISKGIELIGYDTPSPDDSRDLTLASPIHKLFLKKGVVLIEYVANLDTVKNYKGWNIIAAPLRIKGADGSPARIFIYK